MEIKDLIIKDKDFTEALKTKIQPLLKEHIVDGYFENEAGLKLHYQYMVNPNEKASIVMSHGYCEFTTKFAETMYYFYQMGYSVFIMEHRGHGFSAREVEGLYKVYVRRFEDYIEDFNQFIRTVVIPNSLTEHLYLFAHSMGGGIGIRYLETYPQVFEKAVLSSPMIRLSAVEGNKWAAMLVCLLSYIPFLSKKYLPNHRDYDHKFKYPHCSTMSKARYEYQYSEREREIHYRTNGATLSWAREAFNVYKKILKNAHLIKIPVILMQASLDTLVVGEAQDEFADMVPSCNLITYEECKHEIFNATDDIILDYYTRVFDFYQS